MIGDLGQQVRAEIATQSRDFRVQTRALINLDNLPLNESESPLNNPNLRYTDFGCWLKYSPTISTKYRDKPFVLICDLFVGGKIRFKNIPALHVLRKECKELNWVMKNYRINSLIVGIAKMNIDMRVPLPFSIDNYANLILSQENNKDYNPIFRTYTVAEVEKYRKKKWLEEVGNVKGVKI